MPKITVWMVRAALVFMGVGFLFGYLLLTNKGVPLFSWTWNLLPSHITFMIFGWTLQLALGVGFWILPRFPVSAEHPDRYGHSRLAWFGFGLFNAGVLVVGVSGFAGNATIQLAGYLLMLGGVCAVGIVLWPRVRTYGPLVNGSSSDLSISGGK